MRPIYVRGVGLWSPGYAGLDAWLENKRDPSVTKAPAALLEGALGRRATPLTRMAVEVFEQAAHGGRLDTSTLRSVWANAHGEHSAAIRLLEMMPRGEGKVSPTHFHNSVHNTASGYASIASHNAAISTTLTGGTELVASALLEAWSLAQSSGAPVALVWADEVLRPPFAKSDIPEPLALALLLDPQPEGALAALESLRRDTAVPALPQHEHFGRLHVGAALPLVEAVAKGERGTVALELDAKRPGPVWCVDVGPSQNAREAGRAPATT